MQLHAPSRARVFIVGGHERTETKSMVALWHAFVSSRCGIGVDRFIWSLSFMPPPLGDADVSNRSLGSSASFDILPELPVPSTLLFDVDDDGMTTAIGFFFTDKFNGSLYSMSNWKDKLFRKVQLFFFFFSFHAGSSLVRSL